MEKKNIIILIFLFVILLYTFYKNRIRVIIQSIMNFIFGSNDKVSENESILLSQPTFKNFYNKFEEISLPSQLSPYISRDQVCYRDRNSIPYNTKRGGCMVCTVDKSTKYEGTNVISTCVYSTDPNNNDPNIWSKEKCIAECSK